MAFLMRMSTTIFTTWNIITVKYSVYWKWHMHILVYKSQITLKSATIIQYTIKGRFMSR